MVQLPARLPRLVRPARADGTTYVLLEEILRAELGSLFPGQTILESAAFRIARDAELDLDDEGGRAFLQMVEEELRNQRRSEIVRLEIEAAAGEALREMLGSQLGVGPEDIYCSPGPLDIRALYPLVELPALEALRDPPLRPLAVDATAPDEIVSTLDERDLLLHHPYDSFEPVVAFVSRAAEDPDVLAIKQTLYRTSGDSPVVRALARAAERGKQVTVLVELTARFDEQSNIRWARSLEEAGAHVIPSPAPAVDIARAEEGRGIEDFSHWVLPVRSRGLVPGRTPACASGSYDRKPPPPARVFLVSKK